MRGLFALALFLPVFAGWADPPSVPPKARGDALFAASLQDADGRPFAAGGLRDTPLIVNFWARWCAPCRREIPLLIDAARRYPGVRIIGIGLEDQPSAVREFAAAYGITYPLLLAGDAGVELLVALDDPQAGLPYTIAIDRHGQVVFRKLGALQAQDISRAVASLREPRADHHAAAAP